MPSSRLQPWPDWAGRYYWRLRTQIAKLEQMTRWLIQYGIEEQNTPRLEQFLPRLEEAARGTNLICLELAELRGSERWPNWANTAHAMATSRSNLAAKKLAEARRHLERNYWELAGQRLRDCLLAAQEMRQALLAGPAPMIEPTDAFIIEEAEKVAIEQFMKVLRGEDPAGGK